MRIGHTNEQTPKHRLQLYMHTDNIQLCLKISKINKTQLSATFAKKYFQFCANCAKNSAKPRKTHCVSCAKIAQKFAKKNCAKIAQILRKRFRHFVETLTRRGQRKRYITDA